MFQNDLDLILEKAAKKFEMDIEVTEEDNALLKIESDLEGLFKEIHKWFTMKNQEYLGEHMPKYFRGLEDGRTKTKIWDEMVHNRNSKLYKDLKAFDNFKKQVDNTYLKVIFLKKIAQNEKLVSFQSGKNKIYLKYVPNLSQVKDSREIIKNRVYETDPFLIGTTDRNDFTIGELRQFLIDYKSKSLLGCNGENIDLYFCISPELYAPRPGVQRETNLPKILLEDHRTIASYGITEHMVIHVVCN